MSRLTQARGLKRFAGVQAQNLKKSRLTQARGLKRSQHSAKLIDKVSRLTQARGLKLRSCRHQAVRSLRRASLRRVD